MITFKWSVADNITHDFKMNKFFRMPYPAVAKEKRESGNILLFSFVSCFALWQLINILFQRENGKWW